MYFVALLMYPIHRQPVRHLQSNRYYETIIAGETYSPRPRKSKAISTFQFAATDNSVAEVQPAKKRRTAKRKAAKTSTPVAPMAVPVEPADEASGRASE